MSSDAEIPYRDNVSELLRQDRDWSEYPLGTKAHAFNGGAWLRVKRGWKWNGHLTKGAGDTFPSPGADAFGKCVELPTGLQKDSAT